MSGMTSDGGPGGAGWKALSRGAWSQAREIFERQLEGGESAEAMEGLSWAAWWLDDEATVFAARERAYLLYKEGDRAGAARMATWLAADHLDFHGAFAVAGGWLRRARRLLEPLDAGPDHGWLAFFEGYVAHISGDTARAGELGARAAEFGRTYGVPDLEMLGLALQGATHVACAEVDEGMRCLDEACATALAGEATVPISGAWTCCFLVTACTSVLDYRRAFEWCDRIAEFAERYGSRFMLAFCCAHYGRIDLWRGRWADAETLLKRSIEDFSSSRPAWAEDPIVALAELRRLQGRAADASLLLDRAGPSTASQLCRGRLAMDTGEVDRALKLGEKLDRQIAGERRLDLAPVLELLARARIAAGDLDGAAGALDQLRQIEEQVGTPPLKALTDLVEATLAASTGEHERARLLLEDAIDCFARLGAPFEACLARIELSRVLGALGHTASAEREAEAARDGFLRLGAPTYAEKALGLIRRPAVEATPPTPEVTRREREVLAHLAEGLSNRQIAERLVVSEHTVHRHVTNILRKLELPSRSAAAAYAVRSGLLGDRRS
jgi:LuxR family transcriptional regulator, maltose regulon positive regulatory protein